MKRPTYLFLIAGLALLAGLAAGCSPQALSQGLLESPTPSPTAVPTASPTPVPEWALPGWELVWHDEFEGPEIDPANWALEIGGHGWGNFEKQFYSDRPENARIEDGILVIEARQERYITRNYTSARLITKGLQTFMYGRIEARIQIPTGQGIWPAFWLLGDNFDEVSWPQSGEIDIMENIGSEPYNLYGTVHGPGYSGGDGVKGRYGFSHTSPISDDFHVFGIEWEADEIRWYVDGLNYFTLTPADVPGEWVFDQPFFMLLTVAVGGKWPGSPDETTEFPQRMLVDWVRVYSKE